MHIRVLVQIISFLFAFNHLFSNVENSDGKMDASRTNKPLSNSEASNAEGSVHTRGDGGIPQDSEKAYFWFKQSGKERLLNLEDHNIVYHMILNEAWEKNLLVDGFQQRTESGRNGNGVESENEFSIIIDPEVQKSLAKDPVVKLTISPKYPINLRPFGITGKVLTRFIIDEEGNVISPTVEESNNRNFNNNVIRALRQWKFSPAERNGETVKIEARLLFLFKLSPE